jgi:aspartate-semialdehyde dehydrogenase
LPLKPIYDAFGIRRAVITTMQALSGAGYPGVPSLDSLDNVIPYINHEEDKLVDEPLKILGRFDAEAGAIEHAVFRVSPTCTRVPVRDGHMAVLSVELERHASIEELTEALASFQSEPAALGCPSAVDPTIILRSEPNRPQTYLDRDNGHGMAVTVGRIRPCEVFDYKLVVLSHNTVRGAAGASILNAELMVAKGMIQ